MVNIRVPDGFEELMQNSLDQMVDLKKNLIALKNEEIVYRKKRENKNYNGLERFWNAILGEEFLYRQDIQDNLELQNKYSVTILKYKNSYMRLINSVLTFNDHVQEKRMISKENFL